MILYILKSTACFSLLYLVYLFLLRNQKRFLLNRLVLLLIIFASYTIPSMVYTHYITVFKVVPSVVDSNYSTVEDSAPFVVEQGKANMAKPLELKDKSSNPISLTGILLISYLVGVGFLILHLFYQIFGMLFRIYRCNHTEHVCGYPVVVSNRWKQSFSFFGIIVLTENDYCNPNRAMLLRHELVHVRQLHSVDLLLSELFVALHWFNPLVYRFKKSLCEVHEYLADGKVVSAGADPIAYQQLILQCVSNAVAPRVANTFSAKLLKNRFAMISIKNNNTSIAKYLMLVPVLMGLLLLFSFRVQERVELVYPEAAPKEKPLQLSEPQQTLEEAIHDNLVATRSSKQNTEKLPVEMLDSAAKTADSTLLYQRLNGVLDDKFSRIITVFQSTATKPLFRSLYVGFNTEIYIVGMTVENPQPLFELVEKSTGKVIQPKDESSNASHTLLRFSVSEAGDYDMSITNADALGNCLYAVAIPKKDDGNVEVGLVINEKRVMLKKKGVDGLAKVTLHREEREPNESIPFDSISSSPAVTPSDSTSKMSIGASNLTMFNGHEGDANFFKIGVNYPKGAYLGPATFEIERLKESNLYRASAAMEGGWPLDYLHSNIRYPKSYKPKRKNVDIVEVVFDLTEAAEIKNVRVVKGVNPEVDAELVRLVSQMPGLIPEKPFGYETSATYTIGFGLVKK